MRSISFFTFACLITLLMLGCSGGTGPILPDQSKNSDTDANQTPFTDFELNPNSSAGLLGIYSAQIDTIKLEGSLEPLRSSASQDVLETVDITNFMSLSPCTDCVKIHSIELTADGHIALNIGIRHPFPVGDLLKPPSGKNRLDLHVFNVEGIVVMSTTSADSFPGFSKNIAKSGLINASGYTSYLAESLNTIFPNLANLHPYKLHYRDYSEGNFNAANANGFADVLNPSGYLVMPMGGAEDIQQYIFDTPETDPFNFVFAIGCTYGISAINKAARLNPTYSLPQFNKKAASEVFVEVASNNLLPNSPGSSATLNVKILDMNQGIAVGSGLGEMRAESNIAQISVEVPGVTSSPVAVSSPVPTGGTPRDPANPLTFQVTFNNTASGAMGIYRGLVKVTDSYPTGLNESPLLAGSDGITRVGPVANPLDGKFSISEFATYQAFSVEVVGNQPPLVELLASINPVESGCTVEFYPGPGTYDPDGNNLVLYEYDFDYDGVTFDVEASNTTGDPVSVQLINPGSSNQNRTAALRVADDGDPVMTGSGSLIITITPYSLGLNFVNAPTIVSNTPFPAHGIRLDPAICQEDDGQYVLAYVYKGYVNPGFDTVLGLHSSNGLTWNWTAGMIGTADIIAPVKVAADHGDVDSYAQFRSSVSTSSTFAAKTSQDPYEYTWFDIPTEHSNEIITSNSDGHIYLFSDANDDLVRRRSTTAHLMQWPNGFTDIVNLNVSDTDPRLSWVRSTDEDSYGLLFLGYYNSVGTTIKYAKGSDPFGSTWTEGTIWDGVSSGYAKVKDPGVVIDADDHIHVSFVRTLASTSENQLCHVVSYDGGLTFSEPFVVTTATGDLLSTPIAQRTMGCHDVLAIVYEKNDDIMLAISWSGGTQFASDIVIGNAAEPELNPDMIIDSNGDLVFAWELTDAVYQGEIYSRKAQIVVQ